MGRRPYSKKAHEVRAIVEKYPGITPELLMAKMGYKKASGVESLLANCEQRGCLLYEDDNEKLYPWNIEDSEKGDNAN